MEWVQWCVENGGEHATLVRVRYDRIRDLEVSTTFLGLDHRHFGDGPPLVFETAIISENGSRLESVIRASTWEGAIENHMMALSFRDPTIKGPWVMGQVRSGW